MNIFIVTADSNRYQNLVFKSESDNILLSQFDGRSLLNSWPMPSVKVLRDNKLNQNLPQSDFPSIATHVPLFSMRAARKLKGILDTNGEILPVSCDEGKYVMFNVTKVIDALDEVSSVIKRFHSSGRIMDIIRHAFIMEELMNVTIFKIPQVTLMNVYVTGRFRDMVLDNQLVGFRFVKVWEG